MSDLTSHQFIQTSIASNLSPHRTITGMEIELQQIHKNYANNTVLKNLNLHVQSGEFIAIVGRSGCGKSTLLRLIADLEKPSSGTIEFKSPNNRQTNRDSTDIRVMFQDPRLLPWKNIIQNITLGLTKSQHPKAEQLLETVGLASKAQLWPTQLSGGQKQRTALARALSHQPKVLLLDEPLGALDALTRLEMQQLIGQLWQKQGFTAILVTHDVSEAVLLADRIILLEQGHIAAEFNVDITRPRIKNATFAQIEQQVLNAVLATT